MAETERGNRLPIGYEVSLMKMCEKCMKADLVIEKINYYADLQLSNICGIIKCENEKVCRNIIRMCERNA